MWNGRLPGDNTRQHHNSHAVGGENGLGLPTVDAHAVAALASFQQGTAGTYAAYPAPPYNIASVYTPTTADIDYRHLHQIGAHPVYSAAAAQHHLYYHGHHRLPYSEQTDDIGNRVYQPGRHSQDGIDDRYNVEQVQMPYRSQPLSGPSDSRELENENVELEDDDPGNDEEEHEDDEDDVEDDLREEHQTKQEQNTSSTVSRGKPEAIAKVLAAARLEAERRELAQLGEPVTKQMMHSEKEHLLTESETEAKKTHLELTDSTELSSELISRANSPRKTSPKKAVNSNSVGSQRKSLPKAKLPTNNNSYEAEGSNLKRCEFLLDQQAPKLTESEYECLESMMTQFCRVPLLAEFSRPVGLLHPEVRIRRELLRVFLFMLTDMNPTYLFDTFSNSSQVTRAVRQNS